MFRRSPCPGFELSCNSELSYNKYNSEHMPPKKRVIAQEDDEGVVTKATRHEAPASDLTVVKMEPAHAPRTSFKLQQKGDNGKHLMYEMFIKDRDADDSLYVVDYRYGTFGTVGKSYIKCFSTIDEALEFINKKYNELLDKGYGEDAPANGKVVAPLQNPGDLVYLEHRDEYTGEKSFFELEMSKCGQYVIRREGNVGGQGRESSFEIEDAGLINDQIKDHTRRHYKKKARPKFMQSFKFFSDFHGSADEGSGESDDSDTEE